VFLELRAMLQMAERVGVGIVGVVLRVQAQLTCAGGGSAELVQHLHALIKAELDQQNKGQQTKHDRNGNDAAQEQASTKSSKHYKISLSIRLANEVQNSTACSGHTAPTIPVCNSSVYSASVPEYVCIC
jgi:hypothetical protein